MPEGIQPYDLASREIGTPAEMQEEAWRIWRYLKAFIDVPERSVENLELADKYQETGPVVLVAHHMSKIDGAIYPVAVRAHLDNLIRAVGPIRYGQYTAETRVAQVQKRMMDHFGSHLGVHTIPVVTERDKVDESLRRQLHMQYFRTIEAEFGVGVIEGEDGRGKLLGIAPGGTRSRVLPPPGRVKKSYLLLGMEDPDRFLYVPTVLVPRSAVPGWPFRRLQVGRPFFLHELGSMDEDSLVYRSMLKIAELAPEHYQGVYAESIG